MEALQEKAMSQCAGTIRRAHSWGGTGGCEMCIGGTQGLNPAVLPEEEV